VGITGFDVETATCGRERPEVVRKAKTVRMALPIIALGNTSWAAEPINSSAMLRYSVIMCPVKIAHMF
jgi:predicted trehalose synthase